MLSLILLTLAAHASDVPYDRCMSLKERPENCLFVTMKDQWLWSIETNDLVCFDSFVRGGMEFPDDICSEYLDFEDYLGVKPGRLI